MFGKFKSLIKNMLTKKIIQAVNTPVYEGNLLTGKVALIIGGSGGIGSKIAERFVKNGCKVILAGTNRIKLQKLCSNLGDYSKSIVIDACDISGLHNKIDEARQMWGTIDIFVYSSGIHCHDKFGSILEKTWDDVLNVNLKGMFFSCQEVANYMINNQIKGHILTVGSASCAKPGWTPYEISKCAVQSLTLGFADKLIPYGIVVNSIAPGPVATEMLNRGDGSNLTWNGNPTGRMATAEEIANISTIMVSDMGNLIVGDTYFVSGGSGTICLNK